MNSGNMSVTKIISIEGNIGSGKSTIVERLKQYYSDHSEICFLQEPVEEWNDITDDTGKTILSKFYEKTKQYSFAFQMMAYISRLALLRKALTGNYKTIVVERSMFTDKNVFAKMLYESGNIEEVEYKIYNKWFDEFIKELPPIDIIYIKTSPTTAFERVKKRARDGETIALEYLENCHAYHEEWMRDNVNGGYRKMMNFNGDIDNRKNSETFEMWLQQCRIFIEGLVRH